MRNRILVLALAAAGLAAVVTVHSLGAEPAERTPSAADAPPPEAPPPDGPRPPHRDDAGRPRRPWEFVRPGPFGPVTEEETDEIMAFVGEYLPQMKAELEDLKQRSPERFAGLMRRLRFEVRQLRALKERDEKAFEQAIAEKRLRYEARALAQKAREAEEGSAERQALQARLRETVGKLFDAELATREAHLKRIEERLKQLREEMRDQADHRQEIVAERTEALMSGEEPEEPPAEGPEGPDRPHRRPRPEADGGR